MEGACQVHLLRWTLNASDGDNDKIRCKDAWTTYECDCNREFDGLVS